MIQSVFLSSLRFTLSILIVVLMFAGNAALSSSGGPIAPAEKLTVAKIKSLTFKKSIDIEVAKKKAERVYTGVLLAKSAYDWNFLTTFGYQYSAAEALTSSLDPVQRTFVYNSTLSKRISSGTLIAFGYDRQSYSNDLDMAMASNSTKDSKKYLEALSLKINQSLWRNSFGIADRLNEEQAASEMLKADAQENEDLEASLFANMTLFWNAVVAQELVKADDLALGKYYELIRNVRKKSSYALVNAGELPQLEAEAAGYKAQVDAAKLALEQRIEDLRVALQIPREQRIELAADLDLEKSAQVPALDERQIASLRSLRILNQDVISKELQFRRAEHLTDPRFDLVLKARAVGVDRQSAEASAEMMAGSRPDYFVGVEFETPIWGNTREAAVTDASLALQLSKLEQQRQELKLRSNLENLRKTVLSDRDQAAYSVQVEEFRGQALRELEGAYKQGRQSLREVIRAYADLLKAQTDRARAIGQFRNRYNEYLAATDQLMTEI